MWVVRARGTETGERAYKGHRQENTQHIRHGSCEEFATQL